MDINFTHPDEAAYWRVTNDTVMGGESRSQVIFDNGMLIFSGYLSLESNGGFASVWRAPERQLMEDVNAVRISVQGDGRRYQLRFRSTKAPDISYFASFATEAGKTTHHTFSKQDFKPVWRGRSVAGAPRFEWRDMVQVGFLLADKVEGSFALSVLRITELGST